MMKKAFVLFGLLLGAYVSVQVAAAPTPLNCFEFRDGTIMRYYEYEGGGSSGTPCPVDVVIPDQINGIPVTILTGWSFQGSGYRSEANFLKSVRFPLSLKYILEGAFSYNKLSYAELPTDLEYLGPLSFEWNVLTGVKLPSRLKKIAAGTFFKNQITGSLTIPSLVEEIENGAFGAYFAFRFKNFVRMGF